MAFIYSRLIHQNFNNGFMCIRKKAGSSKNVAKMSHSLVLGERYLGNIYVCSSRDKGTFVRFYNCIFSWPAKMYKLTPWLISWNSVAPSGMEVEGPGFDSRSDRRFIVPVCSVSTSSSAAFSLWTTMILKNINQF